MRALILSTLVTMTMPLVAIADARAVMERLILPGYSWFAWSTANLDATAQANCDLETLRPAFHDAWDAWMSVQHLRFGPVEKEGPALAIAFWPDPKGLGARAQGALLAGDPADLEPERFAQQSVAARGLTGMERLLYPQGEFAVDPCPLIRATAADLAQTAAKVLADWESNHAETLVTAGMLGNTTYLTSAEVDQVLFTQLVTGLDFIADQRLGRPLGMFDRPRPERAEARVSGRSVVNIRLALRALRAMAVALAVDAPLTRAAFDHATLLADALPDEALTDRGDPALRLKAEIVQQAVTAARDAAVSEIGTALGVDIGFNAQDGD